MGIMISPEKLRRFPFFSSMDDETIKELAMVCEVVRVKKGEWLFHAGESASALYLILKGKVEVRAQLGSKSTNLIGVSTLSEGDIFGWSSLVQPYVYQMGVVSLSRTELGKFDGVQLSAFMTHYPAAGYKIMSRITETIGRRLTDLRVRFVSLVEGDRWQHLSLKESQYVADGGRSKPLEPD
jgi:CRP-like cAMP-binding protein